MDLMDTLSPVPNRRSRKIAPVDRTDGEIAAEDLLNLEDERLRTRQLVETESQNIITSSDKRLSSALDTSISEHFQSCIQLAVENKINPKNAFSLKLIDLLHGMFGRKKPIKDFTEVSSSLDAGVKIYSCRVDNVHSDTLKMATSVCSRGVARNDDEREEQGTVVNKKRKLCQTRKSTIASARDIDRPKMKNDLKCSYGILTNEKFVTSSAFFDGNKMAWHLNMLQNFWLSEKPITCSRENVSVNIPSISDDTLISTAFKSFQFNDEKTFAEFSSQVKGSTNSTLSIPFDIDFEPNDERIDDDFTFQSDCEDVSETPHCSKSDAESADNHVASLSRMMSSSDFVSEISNMIASEKSDYRYFNFQKLQKKMNAMNTQHWAPLRKKSICEKRVKDEKKDILNFENPTDEDDDLKIFEKKSDSGVCTISASTVPREKFLITPITDFSSHKFFKLNVWRDMFVMCPGAENVNESPYELEEMIEDYDYNNPNDTQNSLLEHHEDDYHDEGESGITADVHEAIERTMFLRDNLVEIPNKVSKVQLPFMVRDEIVDMKELKSKIWKQIECGETEIGTESRNESLTFINICNRVASDEESGKKRNLSVATFFNAILQLANEKNLAFDSSGELTNFAVSVDAANNIFTNGS